jgi:hypothetical protein
MRPFRLLTIGMLLALMVNPLASLAQGPQILIGTWKQNVAKSKASPGPVNQSQTSRWESVPGGGFKNIVETVNGAGRTTRTEQVTKFDGKATEINGSAMPTTREFKWIDDHTYQFIDRVNGKVTTTTRVTFAADGKTRTNVATGTNVDGKPVNNTTVFERQ